MRAVCELMRSYGIPKEAAAAQFSAALQRGYSRSISTNIESRRLSRLADVCTRWHFEKEFVDSSGQALPLRWNGKTGSLLKLARRVVGAKESREVVEELISRRLVKRTSTGGWIPKSKVVSPGGLDNAQIMRSASMIGRLLQTIAHNSERRYKGDVILEVMARVPRLPKDEIPNFKKFTKAQGLIFARAADDWLESRNLRRLQKPGKPTVEAGVVAFAFLHPDDKKRRRQGRKLKSSATLPSTLS